MSRDPHNRVRRTLAAALVGFITFACTPATAEPELTETKALFCAYGGIGLTPNPAPPGFDSEFAVAVVEINSTKETRDASVTDFTLFDRAGKATKFKRVVKIEVFDEPYVEGVSQFAYYLNTAPDSRSRPWNGTLPVGMVHLRVRVALMDEPSDVVRFRLVVGQHTIEGAVDGDWPTG